MKVPEIRWERFGSCSTNALIGSFLAAVIVRSVTPTWHVYPPASATQKIGTAPTEPEARAIAERWIADEWTKLVVATLAEEETR